MLKKRENIFFSRSICINFYPYKYRSAPEGEWGLIYKLASDSKGFLHKDSVKGIYDGKVFYKLEEQRTSSRSDM